MNIRMKAPRRGGRRRGFTLMELMMVMLIIAILAALGVAGYQYAHSNAARKKTTVQMKALQLALETYKKEFGEYPRAANPRSGDSASEWVGGTDFRQNGAQVLYQALSGDGTDQLDLGDNGTSTPSDGTIDDDEEDFLIMKQVDPEADESQMVKSYKGKWLLIDGYGNPWQYRHGDEEGSINQESYDLWSYGNAEDFGEQPDDVHWIRNW